MNSLEKHIQQTLALTNSLVIKITDVAVNINRGLYYSTVDDIPADKTKWKYYLNMSGQLHSSNNNFKVKLVETEETIEVGRSAATKTKEITKKVEKEVTKDDGTVETIIEEVTEKVEYKEDYLFSTLLEEYQYTKEELLKQGNVYKNLIEQYPDEESYIKGCLFPVDINTAIEAKDGTILNWNKNLVETSEYNLIKELESHIQNFLKRWHVSNYTLTDELYVPAMVAVLYSSLPNKIINIRLDKILTNEAHSFHLEHFFRSKLDIWDSVQIFKNETKYWLYKNLPYLIKHLGTNEVLNIIVEKIFEANGIGIGEFVLKRNEPEPTNKKPTDPKPFYEDSEPVLIAKALNTSYDVDSEGITLSNILDNEIRLVNQEFSDSNTIETILRVMKDKVSNINNNMFNQQNTKVLDIKISRAFRRTGADVFKTIMDYWAYLCHNEAVSGKFEFNTDDAKNNSDTTSRAIIEFTDPTTKTLYNLTPYQGFLFCLKLMLIIATPKENNGELVDYDRLNDKIKCYNYTTVFNPDKRTINYIWDKMYHDGWTDRLIQSLIDNYPKVSSYIFNKSSFHEYLASIFQYQYYIWAMDANSESAIVSANLKHIFRYCVLEKEYKLTDDEEGKTIDELIAEQGLTFNVVDRTTASTILNALVGAFTGYDTEEYYAKEELVNSCMDILNKLTAYTTQVITTSDTISSLYLYYNNTNIWRSKNGIIGDVTFDFHGVEHNFMKIDAAGQNTFEDPLVVLVNNDYAQAGYERVPPTDGFGYFENAPEVFSKVNPPRAITEVGEIFNFDQTEGDLMEEISTETTDTDRVLKSITDPVFISGETTIYPDEGTYRFIFKADAGSTMNVLVPSKKGIARVVNHGETTLVDYDPPDVDATETVTLHFFTTLNGETSKLVPLKLTIIGN